MILKLLTGRMLWFWRGRMVFVGVVAHLLLFVLACGVNQLDPD